MTYARIAIAARRVLLDALEALADHRDGLVLVGAQAIYLYTGDADVAIATTTKDSDIALIPARLAREPTLDAAMMSAGFSHDPATQQPGEWSSAADLQPPVELLVPAALHAGGGRRGARIRPHSKHAARVVPGLEAAAVSNRPTTIASLEPEADARRIEMRVASPAALVVAKSYKLGERASSEPGRLLDKDAHDLYRLLNATSADEVAGDMQRRHARRPDPRAGRSRRGRRRRSRGRRAADLGAHPRAAGPCAARTAVNASQVDFVATA